MSLRKFGLKRLKDLMAWRDRISELALRVPVISNLNWHAILSFSFFFFKYFALDIYIAMS